MKNLFLDNYMNIIINNNSNLTQEQIEKYRYGIEGIYLTITKLIIIFFLGIILGIIKEVFLLLLFFNILRFFGFGYHAKSSIECLIISITFFVLLPFLVSKELLVFKYKIVIISLCLLNFFIFAPSDTKKRPLVNKRKRLIRKGLLLLVSLIYSIVILNYSNNISSFIILSLLIEAIMVNPATYKLFGQPYNNYKNYQISIKYQNDI